MSGATDGAPSNAPGGNAEHEPIDAEGQTSASQDRARAEPFIHRFSEKIYRAFIRQTELSADSWRAVGTGGLESRAAAQALAREIAAERFPAAFLSIQ